MLAVGKPSFAGDAVGPAEAFGGGGDVAVGEVAADAGGGDALALELHEVDDVDVDAEGLRVPRQGGGVAAGLVAVGEVLADEDGARVERAVEDVGDEVGGLHRRLGAVELEHEDVVDAQVGGQFGAPLVRCQGGGRPVGGEEGHGVRVEGHQDGGHAECARLVHGRADEAAVPAVDAVEYSDGHHRVAEVGGYVFQSVPDIHPPNPTTPGRVPRHRMLA